MYYIMINKNIGADKSVPPISLESKPEAMERINALIGSFRKELDVDDACGYVTMTLCEHNDVMGGSIDGGRIVQRIQGGKTIARVTIKRPMGSERALIDVRWAG